MKKLLTLLASVLCAVAAFAFAGCGENENKGGSGNLTVTETSVAFTASADVMKITSSTSLKDYLDVLAENKEITFSGTTSEYGLFITEVNGKTAGENSFWAVYTDLVTIEGDKTVYSSSEYGTYDFGGKTLNSANVGVSGLPCIEGYSYALVFSTY